MPSTSTPSLHQSRGTLLVPPPSSPPLPKLLPLLRRVINLALRLAPVDDLKPTEGADPTRVDQLRAEIEADGYLNEPLDTVEKGAIVNGHTRNGALRLLGCRHLLVLGHAVADLTCATWSILNRNPVTQANGWPYKFTVLPFEEFLRARNSLSFATCIVSLADGLCQVFPEEENLRQTLAKQNVLYKVFSQTTTGQPIERLSDETFPLSLDLWQQEFGTKSQILLYPSFSPEQILRVAEAGMKVAPGATRFGYPYRVRNMQLPLWLLRSSESTEEKNRRLQAVLRAHPLVSFNGETFIPQGLHPAAYEEI